MPVPLSLSVEVLTNGILDSKHNEQRAAVDDICQLLCSKIARFLLWRPSKFPTLLLLLMALNTSVLSICSFAIYHACLVRARSIFAEALSLDTSPQCHRTSVTFVSWGLLRPWKPPGPVWDPLGRSWTAESCRGSLLGHPWDVLELSGTVWKVSWKHAGNHPEPSRPVLRYLGRYLGLSNAVWVPSSWAVADALTTRGPAVQTQGKGRG